jgi:hypothetical protein
MIIWAEVRGGRMPSNSTRRIFYLWDEVLTEADWIEIYSVGFSAKSVEIIDTYFKEKNKPLSLAQLENRGCKNLLYSRLVGINQIFKEHDLNFRIKTTELEKPPWYRKYRIVKIQNPGSL